MTLTADTVMTALYDRKLRQAESLECRGLLADLEAADQGIGRYLSERAHAEHELAAAKAALADAEVVAAAGVTGANETERRTNRALAVRDDPAHQRCLAEHRRAELHLAEIDAALDAEKRAARRLERTVEYRIAVMRFLGG